MRYKRKSVTVEAVQFREETFDECIELLGDSFNYMSTVHPYLSLSGEEYVFLGEFIAVEEGSDLPIIFSEDYFHRWYEPLDDTTTDKINDKINEVLIEEGVREPVEPPTNL